MVTGFAHLSCFVEILVSNVIGTIQWSKSKQLAVYIFTCCIALMSNLPLLAGCLVQSLLLVSLWQLAWLAWRRELLGNMTVLGTLSGPWTNIWVCETEGTTDISWHHLHVDHMECTALNICPVRQHAPSSCLIAWVIVPPILQTSLNLAKVGSLNLAIVGS